jgi:broad specificity phosphatase PhoE
VTTCLLLIRHGESVGNALGRFQGHSDVSLSELGRAQAEHLASYLATHWAVSAVYASPLRRAVDTARSIVEALQVPLNLDGRLKEIDVGPLTGLTLDEVKERFPKTYAAWQEGTFWGSVPGGESRLAFSTRVCTAMAEIVSRHSGESVAVVSHGGALGIYLSELLGLAPDRPAPFVFYNASLSIVEAGDSRPRLHLLNDTCYLNGLPLRSEV